MTATATPTTSTVKIKASVRFEEHVTGGGYTDRSRTISTTLPQLDPEDAPVVATLDGAVLRLLPDGRLVAHCRTSTVDYQREQRVLLSRGIYGHDAAKQALADLDGYLSGLVVIGDDVWEVEKRTSLTVRSDGETVVGADVPEGNQVTEFAGRTYPIQEAPIALAVSDALIRANLSRSSGSVSDALLAQWRDSYQSCAVVDRPDLLPAPRALDPAKEAALIVAEGRIRSLAAAEVRSVADVQSLREAIAAYDEVAESQA